MKNKKAVIVIILLILFSITFFILEKLKCNETFYKDVLIAKMRENEYQIEIPQYAYCCDIVGNIVYRLKSLKSKKELDKEIEQILQKYEKKTDENGNIYYYDKSQELTLFMYSVDNDGFFRDILIGIY